MKKIVAPHGSGKTNELIKYAAENGYSIVSHNPQNIMIKAAVLGYSLKKVYDYQTLIKDEVSIGEYVIDDLDDFVSYAFSDNLKGFTIANN